MNNTLTIRPAFTPLTILLMVVGFMVHWILGLAMLAYIMWGDRIPEFRRSAHFAGRDRRSYYDGCGPRAASGNSAFDDYRQREMRRLDEERRRLDEERAEFERYVHNLRRARDQEEFDRFMNERRSNNGGGGTINL